jgi:hypothetical protein
VIDIPLTADMVKALQSADEMPDTLVQAIASVKPDGKGYVLALTGNQAIAMTEMCEWHVRTDPKTGKVSAATKVWDDIIRAVQEAEDS